MFQPTLISEQKMGYVRMEYALGYCLHFICDSCFSYSYSNFSYYAKEIYGQILPYFTFTNRPVTQKLEELFKF